LGAILDRFKNEREQFNQWMSNPDELNAVLKQGAEKARHVASATLQRVREKAGY
jgi:tryptophanyl-tRNA synthetase